MVCILHKQTISVNNKSMLTKTDIEKYFFAEKQESLLFIIIGVITILLAITFFFFLKNNFYKGAAVPLLVIGLVQAIVGYTVHARSDDQRIANVYAFDMNPGKLKNEELPRMKTVNRNFVIYRWVEITLALTGIALIFFYKDNTEKNFWFGLGITLTIQSVLMLGADYFAEKRAKIFTQQLESFMQKK
jgi:membrane-associated phospholipid phosphatase